MKYYLGVDGGGTKTEFVLINDKYEIVSVFYADKSNPNDIGLDGLSDLLINTILSNIPKDADIVDVSLGLSGIAYSGGANSLIKKLKKVPLFGDIYCESDRRISLDASYPNSDGAIGIIGTGNSFYIRKNNECISIGGAGYMYDDSLSAFDIGRLAVKAVIEDIEGRGPHTVLTKAIIDQCGSIDNVIKTTYIEGKKYVAQFSKLVTENYRIDEACNMILKTVMRNFESYLDRISDYVSSITLTGGLTAIWDDVLSTFLTKHTIEINIQKVKPVYGCFVRFGINPEQIIKG